MKEEYVTFGFIISLIGMAISHLIILIQVGRKKNGLDVRDYFTLGIPFTIMEHQDLYPISIVRYCLFSFFVLATILFIWS